MEKDRIEITGLSRHSFITFAISISMLSIYFGYFLNVNHSRSIPDLIFACILLTSILLLLISITLNLIALKKCLFSFYWLIPSLIILGSIILSFNRIIL